MFIMFGVVLNLRQHGNVIIKSNFIQIYITLFLKILNKKSENIAMDKIYRTAESVKILLETVFQVCLHETRF